jgi:putative tryptophan/tyrosine transport system substrate-binding protein
MRRRDFIAGLGGTAALSIAASAQQQGAPVVAFIHAGSADTVAYLVVAFRKGLSENGYAEGQNVQIEYHWLEGQFDRVPALIADLVRRRVAVIVTTTNTPAALAAKAATATIPIVFAINDNPVRLGLVASLAHPGGNLTGVNFFAQEVVSKRLQLLHELVPNARRIAVLVNPSNTASAENTVREVEDAARLLGLPIQLLRAATAHEIEAAFATMAREKVEALFVAPDAFFASRRVQFATLATRYGIPASYTLREFPEVGGLMSFGANIVEALHQVGTYSGRILNGAKPADLPVVQSTRFEFVINLQTARTLGIEVPPTLLALADEVIE